MASQDMLQGRCQFMTMQGDHTVIMVACCDDHGRILLAATCWRPDIVYGTVWVDVSKVLCLIWIPVVTGPCMPYIHTSALCALRTIYRVPIQT